MKGKFQAILCIGLTVLLITLSGCQSLSSSDSHGLPSESTLKTYKSLFGQSLEQVTKSLKLTGLDESMEDSGIWVPDETVAVCGEEWSIAVHMDPTTDALLALSYGFETNDLTSFSTLAEEVLSTAKETYGEPAENGYSPKLSSSLEAVKDGQVGSWFEGWNTPQDVGITLIASVVEHGDNPYMLVLEFSPNA